MLCSKCNKEMKIMIYDVPILKSDLIKYTNVIGRCDDCDFDATWEDVQSGCIALLNKLLEKGA